jgi:pimeloyl-ACP methyl ester carboxylesterase
MGAGPERAVRFVERRGVRICFEAVGEGPPVVLLHGAAGDRTMWQHAGYVEGLDGFTRVLVDARGHGLSGKPTGEAAYRLEEYAADVEAVIDAVGVLRVALWGYSSGAHVAAVVAERVPNRVAALITTGWISDMGTPEERAGLIQLLEASGMPGLNLMLEQEEGISLPPYMCEQFLATDPKVVAAEVKSFGGGEQVRASLGVVRLPALLLVGAAEDPEGEAAKVARLLPAGRALTLTGLGHVGAFLASEQALPRALQTLREGFAS